ncbi:MAG TPA: hypothetical protein VNG51_02550 [Ktedonobacteraceae bacterium]|nr:hypothetical protein [Ktedonobacteraceae bacterium]
MVMIAKQKKKVPGSASGAGVRQKRRGLVYGWELRQNVAWTWVLPLLVIAGSFLSTWLGYQADLQAAAPVINDVHQRIHAILDYINPLRNTLELLLPILSVFLVTDLLLKEWRRGTLMLLATRRSLLWFLAVRFGYLLGYLLVITLGAILLSWWLTPQPLTDLSVGVWLWQTLLTIMAPTLLLMALGMLVAHLSVNISAGYVLPACCWLANWLYALQMQQTHATSAILSYLLFGWSDQNLTPQPEAWFAGKVLLCFLALLLLALQPLLLRRITLQQKVVE